MIFANETGPLQLLLENIEWYQQHVDMLMLEKQTDVYAVEVQTTFCDILPYMPRNKEAEAFNRACELYREVSLVRKIEPRS